MVFSRGLLFNLHDVVKAALLCNTYQGCVLFCGEMLFHHRGALCILCPVICQKRNIFKRVFFLIDKKVRTKAPWFLYPEVKHHDFHYR